MSQQPQRVGIRVTGQIQGVGFRPFVYRLASSLGLTGFVLNDATGVRIEVQGAAGALAEFSRRLGEELPPLAEIDSIAESPAAVMVGDSRFEIGPSQGGELTDAQVTTDIATCDDCLREMLDPADPRYGYPFINCTNCGPRYSIVRRIPYDRPNTTMSRFAMCPMCLGEYSDPGDRRFHAQPVACPVCGPSVWLVDTHGRKIPCDDAIGTTGDMLAAGRIVAIKGLGGFHIACRADDEVAVGRLRRKKHRDAKPFAVMVADLDQAKEICRISPQTQALLTGPVRPIVLCPAIVSERICPQVADGLDTIGVMLPYTPLHHLLLAVPALAGAVLVMTSGNYSEQPLVKDNDAAIAHLGQIVDALLLHNRRIEHRIDDSVVQVHVDGAASVLRRGRGYAPQPVRLGAPDESGRRVLAVGAELKNAVCLLAMGRCVLSEHIGDLKDGRTYRHFIEVIGELEKLFEFVPDVIAADLHPQYLSTQYAMRRHRGEMPPREALPVVRVQHHHAHLVSCLAEHGRTGPAIGLICDGVGYGDDGAAWGCEILRADTREWERLGHLRYLPLIGGDAAARQTYRPAVAALWDTFGDSCLDQLAGCRLGAKREHVDMAVEMASLGANCTPTSSLGRWFDAVAGLCGIATTNRFDGDAPMLLESVADGATTQAYDFHIAATSPFLIDLRAMVEAIVADLARQVSVSVISTKFHNTVAAFLAESARRARDATGLNLVVLSGGCFANRLITARLTGQLAGDGFEVLTHRKIPCNDGGIALGQAVIAAAKKGCDTSAVCNGVRVY